MQFQNCPEIQFFWKNFTYFFDVGTLMFLYTGNIDNWLNWELCLAFFCLITNWYLNDLLRLTVEFFLNITYIFFAFKYPIPLNLKKHFFHPKKTSKTPHNHKIHHYGTWWHCNHFETMMAHSKAPTIHTVKHTTIFEVG